MKALTLLLALLCISLVPSCTALQQQETKAMVKQLGTEIAREAGIAAANTAVTLAEGQLLVAQAKLDQAKVDLAVRQAEAAANGDAPSSDLVKEQLKVSAQQIAFDQARKLLVQARAQLAKLTAVDTLPAVEPVAAAPAP